jgi:hypothetical protein
VIEFPEGRMIAVQEQRMLYRKPLGQQDADGRLFLSVTAQDIYGTEELDHTSAISRGLGQRLRRG